MPVQPKLLYYFIWRYDLKHVFVFMISLLFSTAYAFGNVFEHAQTLEYISERLPELESVNCKFRQEKTVPASGIILKSSGDFVYEKNKGVTFYTTYPIKSTASYTSKEYKQINSIINAISNKSYSKIEKDFAFYYTGGPDNWALGLMPKQSSPSYNYLKSIEIEGNKKIISKIVILPVDSAKTEIWFQ